MKFFSMYSGVGGFEKGIENAFEYLNQQKNDNNDSETITGDEENGIQNAMEEWRCGQEEAQMEVAMSNTFSKPYERQLTACVGGFECGIQNSFLQQRQNREENNLPHEECSEHLERTKWESEPVCVGYSEIDKYAIAVYKNNHGTKVRNYGNADTINAETLPDFDCLVGGFPCQAFSIAGKRGGFNDTRGTQFFNIARIVKQKQPRLLVLENVKGLLSHDEGKTFFVILSTLDELGYDVEWQVLNSKNHGVPQNRERVFIVGHLRADRLCRGQVFPLRSTTETNLANGQISNASKREFGFKDISPCLAARDYKDPKIVQVNQPKHSNDRVYSPEGLSPTINNAQGGNRQPFVKAVLTPNRVEKRQNGRRMKEQDEPSFTVTQQDQHGVYDGVKIRRLTPVECERLQGFPDGWTKYGILDVDKELEVKEMSDTQRYKMMGNAVTTNVVRDVFLEVLK